ncbi:alcohol dehydrogenase catalytic domain-containing protein [Gordonia McavH-238-E]|uniref:alcohol dehydrogenase catalytic domain-containing protein n=1 Tax=Gordonia sp. McavH-238-E TaxID=2917736 RepID=UPI001EF4B06E|nr:alcohol dehydrogenase catalytic domain-containing protein [Gordonia sp. McavH-238-E]MCG7633266.1 alcohol dehydrogenase catalytic domain-containing protein [Gordonia sp. McavH-238-E]
MKPKSMLAVQLTRWGAEPELRRVPIPMPTGEEILVSVGAAGLCRSDLSVMDAAPDVFGYELPMTLGHEVAGTVVRTGSDADRSLVGERVVVHGVWGCGVCRNCARGRENYCVGLGRDACGRHAPLGAGLGYHGGLAQAILVPSARHLIRADGLSAADCAPLADAGLTAYHAIDEHRELIDPHTIAVVVGVGGLGHLAIQILRSLGTGTVVAVDTREDSLRLATRLGAGRVGHSLAEALAPVGSADLIFDFVGTSTTMSQARSLLAPGGRLSVVGGAGGDLTVGKGRASSPGWSVSAPFWGPASALKEVTDLARRGEIRSEVTRYDLSRAVEAYRLLRTGSVPGRAVVIPPPLSGL